MKNAFYIAAIVSMLMVGIGGLFGGYGLWIKSKVGRYQCLGNASAVFDSQTGMIQDVKEKTP